MHTGMLWFDNSTTSLEVKIRKAYDYYQKKYERVPDLCLIHPAMLEADKTIKIEKMTIRPYRAVLPGHIWIGVEMKPADDIP